MRRMIRIGSISVLTFSSNPLIKVGRVSEYRKKSSQSSSSFLSFAKSIAFEWVSN